MERDVLKDGCIYVCGGSKNIMDDRFVVVVRCL